jgi:uncharacterized protein
MRPHTRNLLAALLLEALDNPADARIHLLHALCELLCPGSVAGLQVLEIIRVAHQKTHRSTATLLQAAHRLAASGGPLRVRHAVAGEELGATLPHNAHLAEWLVGLSPEALLDLEAVQQRVGAYCGVLNRLDELRGEFASREPLRWGLAQAATCFNAGLFFEAHEILEGYWRALPTGAIKQFVQGVIQISVGLHHAHEGRFFGAVNLLGRGLEKTAGECGTVLGLDCMRFFPQMRAVRERLLAYGPPGIGRPLPEIPPMRLTPDP